MIKWLKDYFDLSRKEEQGILALIAIIVLLFGLQFGWAYLIPDKKADFTEIKKMTVAVPSSDSDTAHRKNDSIANPQNQEFVPKKALTAPVDINDADSTTLMTVKGIGPAFAHRILAMRRMLGGFAQKTQLMDVYGIGEERYKSIEGQVFAGNAKLHILDINHATQETMEVNPYIHAKMAKAIVSYREKHGLYQQVDDLKKVNGMDDETFAKLLPYVRVGE